MPPRRWPKARCLPNPTIFFGTMTHHLEIVFVLSNGLVLPFWVLMILLPHWRSTQRVMAAVWVIVPLPFLYAWLVIPTLPCVLPILLHPTLPEIATWLGQPIAAVIAWVHFLAFDLFVGRWVYLDSKDCNFRAIWVSPVLFSVLMFGPLGLLLYLIGRALAGRAARVEN